MFYVLKICRSNGYHLKADIGQTSAQDLYIMQHIRKISLRRFVVDVGVCLRFRACVCSKSNLDSAGTLILNFQYTHSKSWKHHVKNIKMNSTNICIVDTYLVERHYHSNTTLNIYVFQYIIAYFFHTSFFLLSHTVLRYDFITCSNCIPCCQGRSMTYRVNNIAYTERRVIHNRGNMRSFQRSFM